MRFPDVSCVPRAVYIVDSGINTALAEVSRATSGWSYTTNTSDCFGHGTAVASMAAGTVNGVAKGANLIAVRVLDCTGSGSMANVVTALEWVLTQANAKLPSRRSVINLSLTGPLYTALNTAVTALTAAGHVVVTAAGNSASDTCQSSPGSTPSCITVAATDNYDGRSSFSSYGACVDLYAPGSSVGVADFNNAPSGVTYEVCQPLVQVLCVFVFLMMIVDVCARSPGPASPPPRWRVWWPVSSTSTPTPLWLT